MMRRVAIILLALTLGSSVFAQTISEEKAALSEAQREAGNALIRSRRYEAAAARATSAAEKARAAAAVVAARIQQSEAEIQGASARIAIIERLRADQRRALAAKQQPVIRLTAALQTMARRPPALALVQPGSLTDLVHTRLLLGATLPLIRQRTSALRADVDRGTRLRTEADAAVLALRRQQEMFAARKTILARLELAQRQRSRELGDSAFLEQERAQAMGEKARDIVGLMAQMDAQATVSARLASLPGPALRPSRPGDSTLPLADKTDAAGSGRPAYRLPVLGRLVTGMGEVSDTGIRSRGLTFATRGGAQVIAPAGGRIRFAQPFKGYGQIVIIDHGGSWTSLITGLDTVSVVVGDTVVQGSPIGRAAQSNARVMVELRRNGQPADIAPLAVRS